MQLDPALAEILASLDPSAETPVEQMTPEARARDVEARRWRPSPASGFR